RVLERRPAAFVREVDLRYAGQGYELTVPYAKAPEEFERLYARRYGMASPGEALEATTWRLTAVLETLAVELPRIPVVEGEGGRAGARMAYFPECGGYIETAVLDRSRLAPGQGVEGPVIVEERESTTVLPPGGKAVGDGYGSLLVSWPPPPATPGTPPTSHPTKRASRGPRGRGRVRGPSLSASCGARCSRSASRSAPQCSGPLTRSRLERARTSRSRS